MSHLEMKQYINNLRENLARYEAENKELEHLEQEYEKGKEEYQRLQGIATSADIALVTAVDQNKTYLNTRLDYFNRCLKDSLAVGFPEDNMEPRVFFDDSGRARTEIYKNGLRYVPETQEGDFCQQLISFSSMATCNILKGSKLLLVDEGFSNADAITASRVSTLLDTLVKEGFQILLIDHKVEVYENLTRREFRLERVPDSGVTGFKSVVKEVIDYE